MSITILAVIINSSLFLKFILFLLVVVLIWSWGMFFEKLGLLKLKHSLSDSFRREFNSGEMLDKIYNRLADKKKIYSPLARIFFVGMKELNASNIRNIMFDSAYADGVKRNIRERIFSSMAVERAKITTELKKGVPYFATIAAVSPFLGLIGTVWELMSVFYSLAGSKSVSLSMIIPGIAQSLLTVIFALFITIFAIFFHNFLITKLNDFIEDTEIFAHDLTNILSRELDFLTTNAYNKKIQERRSSSDSEDTDLDPL